MSASAPSSTPAAAHFDLVVIGGGSGGLAAAKEAAKAHPNKKVLCLDFVQPSFKGTKWGVGGTCVNVGCIPKKLMHHAGSIGGLLHKDAEQFGWNLKADASAGSQHDWPRMQQLISDYICSLNFAYRQGLRGAGVTYAESRAVFDSPNSLVHTTNAGKATRVTFDRAIIATGGRPAVLPLPGWQLSITSDDLFWRKQSPGKTLVIGGGYIALESASFLHHLGLDTSVMVRGDVLRGMDQQAANQVAELMERDGVRFLRPARPQSFRSLAPRPSTEGCAEVEPGVFELAADAKGGARRLHVATGVIETRHVKPAGLVTFAACGAGPIEVTWEVDGEAAPRTENFDTVVFATGRVSNLEPLGLDKAGVYALRNKIIVDERDATSNPRIFAIGDVAAGVKSHALLAANPALQPVNRPELTPVAIQAGQLLAQRLWTADEAGAAMSNGDAGAADSIDDSLMDYRNVATTVFTSPSEYAFVGMSEEEARRPVELGGIGSENVEVYWSRFGSLEISPLHPVLPEQRSTSFTGPNLWAEQFIQRNRLLWPEQLFNPSGPSCRVLYRPSSDAAEEPAAVTAQNVASDDDGVHGTVTYTIKLNDGLGAEVENVSGAQLRLQPDAAVEHAELLYKANSLAKVVVDRSRGERIVGLHFIGNNAGEVLQGFALGVALGARKKQLDRLVGIHPTVAEEFTVLTVTQSSGKTLLKQAGCGGGSCG